MERFIADDSGAGLVEYALLITLIVLVAFLAVGFAGQETSNMWSDISTNLEQAGG